MMYSSAPIATWSWALLLAVAQFSLLASPSCCQDNHLEAALDSLITSVIRPDAADPIHHALVQISGPTRTMGRASGSADGQSVPMTTGHGFKIASIGKMFTAAVVFQLIEEGALRLDDTLGDLAPLRGVEIDSLHVLGGISSGRGITVRQLVSHTSGLRDPMEDPRFLADVAAAPQRHWPSGSLLDLYYEYELHTRPHFFPGEGFAYADPNYVLLGLIIERKTGTTLAESYRQRIFEPLVMENSYLEHHEEIRGSAPLAHAFHGQTDLSLHVNTSFDWGGGGIVSTATDLMTFLHALFEGLLFRNEETLEIILASTDHGHGWPDAQYGYGIMKRELGGRIHYGHGGAYDCDLYFCPETGTGVCTVLDQMNTHGLRDAFLERAATLSLELMATPLDRKSNE